MGAGSLIRDSNWFSERSLTKFIKGSLIGARTGKVGLANYEGL